MNSPAQGARGQSGAALLTWAREGSVYVALAALVLLNLVVTPGFSNPLAARSLLFEAAPVILIALGQNLAIATRGIDLSVGSVMALSSAMIAVCLDYGTGTAIVAAIAIGLVAGIFNGALVSIVRIDPLISGLALLVAARGLAQSLTGGSRVNLPPSDAFDLLGTGAIGPIPVVILIGIVLAIVIAVVVRRTTFGRYTILIGASRGAAFLAGIPVRRTLFMVYAASGVLAGLAGVMASSRLGAADPNYVGVNFELDSIAASVIGGTPLSGGRISIVGTVFGVLLLQVLDASFIMNNISFTYAQILKAVFIVVALYLQRQEADVSTDTQMRAASGAGTGTNMSTHGSGNGSNDAPHGTQDTVAAAAAATASAAPLREHKERRNQIVRLIQSRGAIGILVIVCAIAGGIFPDFLHFANLADIVSAGSFLGLIVIGQSLVIILGGFDLSVGSMVGLGTVIAAYAAPYGWGAAMLAPIVAGLLVGFVNGVLIARARMAPFIVTLAALLGLKGLALVLASQDLLIANPGFFTQIANGSVFGISSLIWILLIAYAAGALVLNCTPFGAAIFAIGGNEEAARMLGVRVERVKIATYGLSGALAGLAGALLASHLDSGLSGAGTGYELQSIAAAVIGGVLLTGGVGTMAGPLAGAILLGVIENVINQVGTLSPYYQNLASGAFLLIAVVLQTLLTSSRKQ